MKTHQVSTLSLGAAAAAVDAAQAKASELGMAIATTVVDVFTARGLSINIGAGKFEYFLGERSETLQLALVIVHGLCIPRPHSSILFLRINALLAIPMCARTHKTFKFQF